MRSPKIHSDWSRFSADLVANGRPINRRVHEPALSVVSKEC